MTLDRTGEPIDPDVCPHGCRKGGWLTPEDADLQIPCPLHRPRRTPTEVDDYDPSRLSERARAAIEKADRDE
jgi:hypothetical protein